MDDKESALESQDDPFAVCLGELYRYRLAANEQEPRIRNAIEEVRALRDGIEAKAHDLLFAPSMSREAFKERLEALYLQDVPSIWRLKTEAEFQLIAIYGLYSMARALRALGSGDRLACIQQSLATFERAAPDADLLRHLHTHIADYVRGKGKDRDRLPDPDNFGGVAMLDERLVYWVGGKLFDLRTISEAAETLGAAIAECTR